MARPVTPGADEQSNSSSVVKSAAGMGAAAAVSRGFGAARVLVIAAVLGTTYLGNAFQGSNSVSNVLFELLAAGALSAVLVPTFQSYLDTRDRAGAEHLAGELLGVAVIVLGTVSVLGVAASSWIADLLTSGVDDPAVAAQQAQLTRFLLWFFIPQVVLYAVGAIATAVLHANRRFMVPAVAPIGNTVVMIGFLFAFRVAAGPDPGLDLSLGEKLLLAGGGTLGVVAFVAAPTIAVWRSGFRLRPRFTRTHDGLRTLIKLSGWASMQHGFAALLLGAAIVAGGSVEGGVVAYQVGWFFFLAPYGIIAQPIYTTILPELVAEHGAGDDAAFAASLRWALDSMCVLLVPLSALCVALAVPTMSVLAFGQAGSGDGVSLLAASLASLAIGMLPYGAFFLLARAWYVYGDSRTPALAGGVAALVGVAVMATSAALTTGTATIFGLGLGHSIGFASGSLVLLASLRVRTGHWIFPRLFVRSVAASAAVGVAAWLIYRWWAPATKLTDLVALIVLAAAALGGYVAMIRLMGVSVTKRLPRGRALT